MTVIEHRVAEKGETGGFLWQTCVCGERIGGISNKSVKRAMSDHITEARRAVRTARHLAIGRTGDVPADLARNRAGREEKRLAIQQNDLLT